MKDRFGVVWIDLAGALPLRTGYVAVKPECFLVSFVAARGEAAIAGEFDVGFVSPMDVHPMVMDHLGHPAKEEWGLDGTARGLN